MKNPLEVTNYLPEGALKQSILSMGQTHQKKYGYLEPYLKMAMGATTAPVARGDLQFARLMANKMENPTKALSIDDMHNLMKIAKANLNIPMRTFTKMTPQQLIAEILGLAEKRR